MLLSGTCFAVDQQERLNRSNELSVVHESLLEEDAGDEGEALLGDSEKVRAERWCLSKGRHRLEVGWLTR